MRMRKKWFTADLLYTWIDENGYAIKNIRGMLKCDKKNTRISIKDLNVQPTTAPNFRAIYKHASVTCAAI